MGFLNEAENRAAIEKAEGKVHHAIDLLCTTHVGDRERRVNLPMPSRHFKVEELIARAPPLHSISTPPQARQKSNWIS
jgi:hypothetical protein